MNWTLRNRSEMNIGGTLTTNHCLEAGEQPRLAWTVRFANGPHVEVLETAEYVLVVEGKIFGESFQELVEDIERLSAAFGYFGYVRRNKRTGIVDIGTDRLGYFPMYFAQEDGVFHFGSSLNFVKCQLRSRSVNFEAWEELLVLGEIVGEKTTIAEISRLAPGTRIRADDSGIGVVRFWEPEIPEPMPHDAYVRENNRLLIEAMRKSLTHEGKRIVPLSGGEDSRRIAIAAAQLGVAAEFWTQKGIHRGGVDNDTLLASQVAETLGHKNRVVGLPSWQQYLQDCHTRDVLLGFECTAHQWLLPLVRAVPTGAIVYDGIIGDVSINGHYFKAYPEFIDSYDDTARWAAALCGNEERPWLQSIREHVDVPLIERVKSALDSYPDHPHRLTYYFLLNHTRRKISLLSQFYSAKGVAICYPYSYYPLLRQSLSADPRAQQNRFLHRDCMQVSRSKAAEIPTTRERLPDVYCVDMSREAKQYARKRMAEIVVSEEALAYFPSLRKRYRLDRTIRFVPGMASLANRLGWYLNPLARFGAFLEWLRRSDPYEGRQGVIETVTSHVS